MWCGTSITFEGRTPRSQTSVGSSRDFCPSGPQSPHLTNGDRPAFGKTQMCQASGHKENPKGPELISQDGQAGRHRPGKVEHSESQGPLCTGSAGRAQAPKREPDCFSLLPSEAPRSWCGCNVHGAGGRGGAEPTFHVQSPSVSLLVRNSHSLKARVDQGAYG